MQVRRWFVCPCQGKSEAKSIAALDFGGDGVAPELAYVTARYAAIAPVGKVAALLSELLPISETQHANMVRSRTLQVGTDVRILAILLAGRSPAAAAEQPGLAAFSDGGQLDRPRATSHDRLPLSWTGSLCPFGPKCEQISNSDY
ncbi:MAG: hypothetical protein JO157_07455 [Acetobacteraceae bacterium]|nr:hypothetical protein [Acetobacteraceae bacterium]